MAREQFSVPIKCGRCGQQGNIVWEENVGASPRGPQTAFVSVSSGFYERVARNHRGSVEIVCQRCNTVLPDE
jgi:ribosomal protein L37E